MIDETSVYNALMRIEAEVKRLAREHVSLRDLLTFDEGPPADKLLTVQEVARRLGVSRNKVSTMIKNKELRSHHNRVSGQARVRESDLQSYIDTLGTQGELL